MIYALAHKWNGPLKCVFEMRKSEGVFNLLEYFNADGIGFKHSNCAFVFMGLGIVRGRKYGKCQWNIRNGLVFEAFRLDLMATND